MTDSPDIAPAPLRPIRVMIVDDSAIIRALIERILKTDPHITICGFASDGQKAVDTLKNCDPDVVVLDIEMPVMDGITALPLLLAKKPGVKILICSTLSDRGAAISIKALALGATECLLKPTSPTQISENGDFHKGLLRLVRHIGASAITSSAASSGAGTKNVASPYATRARSLAFGRPKVLAIGCSTGGPNALGQVLPHLRNLPVPIVITQHMPKTFTRLLAEHLTTTIGLPCAEGAEGMPIVPGKAYIAPGGLHMGFIVKDSVVTITLNDGPPENFCKPAVDPMLRSLLAVYGGPGILSVILTGMGEDGAKGVRAIVDAGGQTLAQDEATSIVWGMPGAVAKAGLAHSILPLGAIGGAVRSVFSLSGGGAG